LSRHDGSCESQEGFHRGRSYEPSCDAAGQDCVDSIDLAALAETGVVGFVRGTTKSSKPTAPFNKYEKQRQRSTNDRSSVKRIPVNQ
jgi:hypothetical protein